MARIRQTPANSGVKSSYRCTACRAHIRTSFEACLHPLLQCLICRKCHTSYGTGDFSQFNDPETGPGVDEFGDDNYCRWCVDGGDLFACGGGIDDATTDPNRCHYAFCSDCITRNVPNDPILSHEQLPDEEKNKFKWQCFACDPSKLKDLRRDAQEAIQALNQKDLKRGTAAASNGVSSAASSVSVSVVNSTNDPTSSAVKKRRTESVNSSEQSKSSEAERSKDRPKEAAAPEKERVREKEKNKELNKDAERERPREKDKNREPTKDGEKERAREKEKDKEPAKNAERERVREKEKEKSKEVTKEAERERAREKEKEKSKELTKEPEASLMPPLEKPRQPVTTLRKLVKAGASAPTSETKIPKQTSQASSASNDSSKTTKLPTASTSSAAPSVSGSSASAPQPLSDLHLQRTQSMSEESSKNSSQQQFRTSQVYKPKPLSKQLKQSNEQINPSTKVILTEAELKRKLETYEKVKQTCITEIGTKFQTILEMFLAKELENKTILKFEIEDLERPLQEFNTMLRDLKSLYNSQT